MIYDITTCKASLSSLSQLTNQSEEAIRGYLERNGASTASEFLDEFGIPNTQLLERDVWCTSLHVTSNNDHCQSLIRHGLLNLREAISRDTPLNQYLNNHDITIDLAQRTIYYKGKTYDISKRSSGLCNHRLFRDFEINGFFSYPNVLKYGDVNTKPEFLLNLARLLKAPRVASDWENNRCYVIQFIAPMCDYQDISFIGNNEPDSTEVELMKREAMIAQAISNINRGFLGEPLSEVISYVQPNTSIPSSNFRIYTADEYLATYEHARD